MEQGQIVKWIEIDIKYYKEKNVAGSSYHFQTNKESKQFAVMEHGHSIDL